MSMVSKGAIDAATGITALVSGMEQSFGGMMDQQSETISGTWSTLMDGLEQSAAQVGLQIAEALNLTGLFQSLGDMLTNFAATVQSSGLTEALLTAIPPEFFQAGILLIVSTLTGLAIPAIGLFVTKVTLMAAPFLAAVAAAAPFIGVAAAMATALYAIWKSGMTVEDVLGTMGIKMETVTRAVDAVQAMMSAAAQSQALEPVFTLVAAVMGAAFYAALQVIGGVVNGVLNFISVLSECVTWILNAFTYLVEGIGSCIDEVGSILSDMAGSILPSWASSALSTIANFVSEAISWPWVAKAVEKVAGAVALLPNGNLSCRTSAIFEGEAGISRFLPEEAEAAVVLVAAEGAEAPEARTSWPMPRPRPARASKKNGSGPSRPKAPWWTGGIRKKRTNWKNPDPPTRTTNGIRPVWQNCMPRSGWMPFLRNRPRHES